MLRTGHWAIENKLHWVLDVTFGEDLSRLRTGHGAMAVVRHFALDLVRQVADKRSIKRRRKRAAWDPQPRLVALRYSVAAVTLSLKGHERRGIVKPRTELQEARVL
jgi:hypothetical protein